MADFTLLYIFLKWKVKNSNGFSHFFTDYFALSSLIKHAPKEQGRALIKDRPGRYAGEQTEKAIFHYMEPFIV